MDFIPINVLTGDRPDLLLDFGTFIIFWIASGLFIQYVLSWSPDNDDF